MTKEKGEQSSGYSGSDAAADAGSASLFLNFAVYLDPGCIAEALGRGLLLFGSLTSLSLMLSVTNSWI
jgi:hypothetical protein